MIKKLSPAFNIYVEPWTMLLVSHFGVSCAQQGKIPLKTVIWWNIITI